MGMIRGAGWAIMLVWALSLALPARACVVDRYGPYDPTRYSADTVFVGTVVADGIVGREPFADIKVKDVLVGTFAPRAYRLKWWINDGSGMCSPPGPDLKSGQQVLVYLVGSAHEAIGWTPVYREGAPLPTVRDAMPDQLLARLAKEDWFEEATDAWLDQPLDRDGLQASEYRVIDSDADLRVLVRSDQATAKLREQRERDYHFVGGARSINDPDGWFAPAERRVILGGRLAIEVRFKVGADGRINQCGGVDSGADRLAAAKLCALLRQRAKMIAPIFEEERSGYFEMRQPRR